MISNCGKDENRSISGGQAGDQTGQEFWKIPWYNGSWNCIIRHPSRAVGELIAKIAAEAADNDLIGYDQSQRLTFWQQLQKVGYYPRNIMVACEADCSSAVSTIVKAAGYILELSTLKNIDPGLTTYTMRCAFAAAGFNVLGGSIYTTSDKYLLPGDILLNESAHTAVNLTAGSLSGYTSPATDATDDSEPENPQTVSKIKVINRRNYFSLQNGSGLNKPQSRVKAWQCMLQEWGYLLTADGEFGSITESCTNKWKQSIGREANGVVDEEDWKEIINIPE